MIIMMRMMTTTMMRSDDFPYRAGGVVLLVLLILSGSAQAQLLRKNDYGVGVTVAIYQFDDTRSKKFTEVNTLKQTVSTSAEEVDYITRNFGVEELKVRHIRTIGLREGETYTDPLTMNEKEFSYTIIPRIITRNDVTFDFSARYGDQVLLEVKSVTAGNYETVMLRGEQSGFGVREFAGPNGPEKIPEKRALIVTVTPAVQTARSLQNKPTDLSRPTDQFGSKIEMSESDTFIPPALINRAPLKFPPGAKLKGSITLSGIITPEGRVTNIKVLDTPDPGLNPKAVEAFREYRFSPAKLNGRATYATYRETIVLAKEGPI